MDHVSFSTLLVVVLIGKPWFSRVPVAGGKSTDTPLSILLITGSFVVLLLVLESVELARSRSGVGHLFVISWLRLGLIWF